MANGNGNGSRPKVMAKVADIGDAWVAKPYELTGAHSEIQAFFERVRAAGIRPLTCGGDHSVSLPILRALAKDGPVGMIHIDAHADTGDDYGGSRFHHGAPFKIAVDEENDEWSILSLEQDPPFEAALVAIDVASGDRRDLDETMMVDDQVEFLDNDTILYAKVNEEEGTVSQPVFDIWALDLAPGSTPRMIVPFADSPAA